VSENPSDTAAAVKAGADTVKVADRVTWVAHPQDPDVKVPISITAGGGIALMGDVLAVLDKRFVEAPRANTTKLTEVDSLIAHLKRWGSDATVVYADSVSFVLEAVLDDYPADATTDAMRAHRAVYACPRSPEWVAWCAWDGKAMNQTTFADFIESRLEDMVGADGMPKPTDVLMVARQLNILTKGTFQREINPTNGDSIFVCKTETDAKSTQIPRAFMIGVPVFEGGTRYQVEARVRFALVEGRPAFSYTLHRRAEIERDAFGEVRAKVAKETGRLVLAGTP